MIVYLKRMKESRKSADHDNLTIHRYKGLKEAVIPSDLSLEDGTKKYM